MAQLRSPGTDDSTQALAALTEEIGDLRPLGATARMVMRITSEDRFSAHELANAISADQALTAKMLRLSNSAYYGFARRITTMRDAVVLLGFREVRATTMASCVIEAMPMSRHINYETFWHYSVSIGMLAEVLARAERLKTDEAFTAGVVHNIGRLALDQARPAAFGEALAYSSSRKVSLHEAERAVFGFTDAELGASLATYWGFPPELTDAVEHHWVDAARQKDPRGLAAFVSRARVFARAHGSTDGVEPAQEKCEPPAEWSQAPIASSLKVAGGVEGVKQRAGAFMEFAGIR
jgi:HD-like signal output (HDOD) protein